MIRSKPLYSDSRRKGVACSALEPKHFSELLFRDVGDPYIPGAMSGAGGLKTIGLPDIELRASRANSRRALLMETPKARIRGVDTLLRRHVRKTTYV